MDNRESNLHHIIYPRRHYKSPSERALRRHSLLVIRMPIEVHNDLHALLQPPRKLKSAQIMGAVSLLNEMQADEVTGLEAVNNLADYLNRRSKLERLVGGSLLHQMDFFRKDLVFDQTE